MKQMKYVVMMVLALLMGVAAHAQTGLARTTVPFEFSIGGTVLPAGEYQISKVGEKFVLIENLEGAAGVKLVLDKPIQKLQSQQPKLVFHKFGEKYFLAEAWLAYSESGYEFYTSKEELNMALANQPGQELTLVATKR